MNKETVHFIITGGTIDSYYEGTQDTVVPNAQSSIPLYIHSLKLYTPSIFTVVCMKDSREITKKDQKKILTTIQGSSSSHIIITHGTYTMPDTARYLKANLREQDKKIILTGSMIPLAGFTMSDGPFNIGFSMAMFSQLENGVYVCMNGRVFESNEVMKVIKEGRFSSIFGEKK